MNVNRFEFQLVDLRSAGDEIYAAVSRLMDRIMAESHPEDPLIALEERVARWKNRSEDAEVETWIAWQAAGELAGMSSSVYSTKGEDNKHILGFKAEVLPERRRRGLGCTLLSRSVDMAERSNRRLLISSTSDRVPAGEAFLTACGAQPGLALHTNQLLVAEVDRALLQRWVDRAPADRFELGVWEGAYPDSQLEAVARLWQILNDAPRGRLELDDVVITTDQLRQMERSMFAGGTERWSLHAREKRSGDLAGFTEVHWNARRPTRLGQGTTGVFPAYRRQGLGRWLKAEMLQRILRLHPEIERVRTGNADANVAMLKINRELGYRPYIATTVWQLDVARAREFVGARRRCGGEQT